MDTHKQPTEGHRVALETLLAEHKRLIERIKGLGVEPPAASTRTPTWGQVKVAVKILSQVQVSASLDDAIFDAAEAVLLDYLKADMATADLTAHQRAVGMGITSWTDPSSAGSFE